MLYFGPGDLLCARSHCLKNINNSQKFHKKPDSIGSQYGETQPTCRQDHTHMPPDRRQKEECRKTALFNCQARMPLVEYMDEFLIDSSSCLGDMKKRLTQNGRPVCLAGKNQP